MSSEVVVIGYKGGSGGERICILFCLWFTPLFCKFL